MAAKPSSIRVLVRNKGPARDMLLYYVDPLTGREVSKTAGTRDKGTAERAAALWEQELSEYRGEANDGWQFFRDRFRDEHLAALSKAAQASYSTALNHYQRLMAPVRLADVTTASTSVFQAKLMGEKSRPLSSIGNYLTHLRSAFNWARHVGMMREAPSIKLPRQTKRLFLRGKPLTEIEYRAMLMVCDEREAAKAGTGQPWRRLLELLWLSGLRLSEAMRLSWASPPIVADLDATPYPQLLFYGEGQKSRQDEAVPMTPDLAEWLGQTPPAARIGPVVPLPLELRRNVSERIGEITKAAGRVVDGTKRPAHDFRRAFGQRWAQKVMPATLQKLMRHADISTTLRFYVGITATDAGRELWGNQTGDCVPKNVPTTDSDRTKAG